MRPAAPEPRCGRGAGRPANPFAVEFVRPGAIAFVPGAGHATSEAHLAEIERALRAAGGTGAILGPHGSGKTTLLVHLVRRAEAAGRPARLVRTEPGDRWPRPRRGERLALDPGGRPGRIAAWWRRRRLARLARAARRRRAELVVAAHGDAGLPVIHRREVRPAEAARIVEALLARGAGPAGPPPGPGEAELDRMLHRHRGSLREVLFECYDRWESGWPDRPPDGTGGRGPGGEAAPG